MQAQGNSPADTLPAEAQTTNRLLALLKQEQACLISAKIDGLNELMQEKANMVMQMTELGKRRYTALAAAGFEATELGMQTWTKTTAAEAAAVDQWKAMIIEAQAAKEINRTNGLLINKHMTNSQNALNILRGTKPNTNIYGPDGQATNSTTSRNLVIG